MTPGARFAAAEAILEQFLDGTAAEQALTRWARASRFAGSKDRAAVRDHVYDVLRQKGSCAKAGGGETARALMIGLARVQGLDLDALFSGQGHAPKPLSAAEKAVTAAPVHAVDDLPPWTHDLLSQRASDLGALAEQFAVRAPLWLRINLRRTTRADVAEALVSDGMEVRGHPDVSTALEVTAAPRRLRQSSPYLDGLVEPQDLSVQAAMQAIHWPDEGRVLDYCAGGGGKALAIADRSRSMVFAHDVEPRRMVDLAARAARAQVSIERVDTRALADLGPFDVVLADVPCSGSGTWRRDPEAKWRTTPQDLDRLVTLQAEILDQAAALVAERGRLIYMTCSLFEAENEAQIAGFVARHAGWRCARMKVDTPLTASDGFFSAELARNAP